MSLAGDLFKRVENEGIVSGSDAAYLLGADKRALESAAKALSKAGLVYLVYIYISITKEYYLINTLINLKELLYNNILNNSTLLNNYKEAIYIPSPSSSKQPPAEAGAAIVPKNRGDSVMSSEASEAKEIRERIAKGEFKVINVEAFGEITNAVKEKIK